jgi:5,10-methylenetetrahydrofolate reductase
LRKGMEICARHIRFLKENQISDGVHIMAIGREELVPEILAMAGLATTA